MKTHATAVPPPVKNEVRYTTHDIIRLRENHLLRGFRVWKVTAVVLGGLGVEDHYQLMPLDLLPGGDDTTGNHQSLVPCWMLETHPGIEKV